MSKPSIAMSSSSFSFPRSSVLLQGLLPILLLHVLALQALLPSVSAHGGDDFHPSFSSSNSIFHEHPDFNVTRDANGCTTIIHHRNPLIHKDVYRVGVYASEGDQVAHDLYGKLFGEYLTEAAGKRFDPPIRFELVPVSLRSLMNMAEEEQVDFLFGSSAVFSCMATEYKAQALVTIINKRTSRGHSYDLDLYGGVMFVMANNKQVNSIQDFKGRTIGAGAITAMGGGQTQFYSLFLNGISYVADPAQVIFVGDERLVVQGLLDGDFEIAFARTDQIERHTDANGDPLPHDTFKIINPQTHILEDGTIFPFVSSTGLHPEWPVAALDHTDRTVSKEVQEALLAISDHALALDMNQKLLCHTTPHIAQLAHDASVSGSFTGFRTARSYFGVRTKQEAAGFIQKGIEDAGALHCIRGDTLYQDIQCPPQYYKVTEEEFDRSCEDAGLPCKEGYECFCQPCVKAFEVDVFQYNQDYYLELEKQQALVAASNKTINSTKFEGCDKMSLCGEVQQTKEITLRAVDNLERPNANMEAIMHLDRHDIVLQPYKIGPFTYEMKWSYPMVGVGILELFVDGVQIPESPLRVQVVERDCDIDFEGKRMIPNEEGVCECGESTIQIRGECVDVAIFAVIGSVLGVLMIGLATLLFIRHKNRKSDEVWQVFPDELHFDEPMEVIGQGSFGVVVLAEYRGTKVAIKRVISPNKKRKKSGTRSSVTSSSGGAHGKVSAATNLANIGYGNGVSAVMTPEPSGNSVGEINANSSTGSNDDYVDVEAGAVSSAIRSSSGLKSDESGSLLAHQCSVTFLKSEIKGTESKWDKFMPWKSSRKNAYQTSRSLHESVLGSAASNGKSSTRLFEFLFPCFSETARRHEEFKTEMRVLARLRHPCITTVMGAVVTHNRSPIMVMEYMEYGSLHDLLRNDTMLLSGEIILQITRDLAQGLRFLHANKPHPILHGDLKARNILIDSRFRAKLCDFGLSTKRTSEISGTPFWLAPEYLMGEKYTPACDIYSVGVIFYEIYARKGPYEGENFKQVIRAVCNRRINKRPKIPPQTPPKFVDLMKKCWSNDVHYRPAARVLDTSLMEMSAEDAEPASEGENQFKRVGDPAMTLYDIFPKHVADALKKGQKVEPEKHELVTVIFSDIIDFTKISRELGPEKVCDMLDRLYVAFDNCARTHQVFKVETIGDAWMGVTNLENNQEDCHVKNIAEFAVDMVNAACQVAIDKDDPTLGFVRIRVGFHSGSVVSNVIGSLNKRYCLFGDTVNTASRMETNSAANRILCSERSYLLLKKQCKGMHTKRRGTITVKGKGEMAVYWVGDTLLIPRRGLKEKAVEFDLRRSSMSSDDPLNGSSLMNASMSASFKSTSFKLDRITPKIMKTSSRGSSGGSRSPSRSRGSSRSRSRSPPARRKIVNPLPPSNNKNKSKDSNDGGYIGDVQERVPSSEETPTMDSDTEDEADNLNANGRIPRDESEFEDEHFQDAMVNGSEVVVQ